MIQPLVASLPDFDDIEEWLDPIWHLFDLEEHELHSLEWVNTDDSTLQLLIKLNYFFRSIQGVHDNRV